MRRGRAIMVGGLAWACGAFGAQAEVGIPDAQFVFGWSNYIKRHCPPWEVNKERAMALLREVPMDGASRLRIASGAATLELRMEREGDIRTHCQEMFQQLGPTGLNMLQFR